MRQITGFMRWGLGVSTLLASCVAEPSETKTDKVFAPLEITDDINLASEGLLEFNTTVFAENPTTLLEQGDFHGYEFHGQAGGRITISMTGESCGAPDTFLYLFGPEDEFGERGTELIANDDFSGAACGLDSRISNFTLPVNGTYLIVAGSFLDEGGGNYRLNLACNNGVCQLPGELTFAQSRISQIDIDNGVFTPDELFEIGDFLFEDIFRIQNGMGNALIGSPAGNNPRPNFRFVHEGAFGAPEAQSCLTCHNIGGDDGAGDLNHNIFQIGNGVDPATGVPRNPSVLLGLGLREAIGAEMTAQLQGQLAAAKASAASTGANVTANLASKGVSFGSVVARPDGTVDNTNLRGVDADLVVKPFGWKGREALLRRFVEGGYRVHFGMQTQPQIVKHCATPNPAVLGDGPDCQDPDGDGVKEEITEGQLTATAVYMALLESPVRVPPPVPAVRTRATQGEQLFGSLGCASCHKPTVVLNKAEFVEPADTTGGAGILMRFATDMKEPHPPVAANGSVNVELWSDFKRHDMGAALADSKPFGIIPPSHFITPPLWGVATSPPYLHDGRAPTLRAAILGHGGEALAARNAFAALTATDQEKVVTFLGTLGRAELLARDIGGFVVSQVNATASFQLPAGTEVPRGGFLVIARNATKAQFQSFYGKTLGENVVFINSVGKLPLINGSERFTFRDRAGSAVDGPTIPQPAAGGVNLQRVNGGPDAGATASWIARTASIANATPGAGQTATAGERIYISEFTDATNANFEFVEIFVE